MLIPVPSLSPIGPLHLTVGTWLAPPAIPYIDNLSGLASARNPSQSRDHPTSCTPCRRTTCGARCGRTDSDRAERPGYSNSATQQGGGRCTRCHRRKSCGRSHDLKTIFLPICINAFGSQEDFVTLSHGYKWAVALTIIAQL